MNYLEVLSHFKCNSNFNLIIIDDPDYEYARSISNSRFHYRPGAIAFCGTPEDVASCLTFCKKQSFPFRIRSGGHHHEGMSSGNGVMIIDLSQVYRNQDTNEFKLGINLKDKYAWIPSGMKLDQVYDELRKEGMIIPGGGCQSVNVGGLTQGGGWGVHVRKYGLACDQLLDVEIVLANGEVTLASKLPNGEELLWALRGGGGGNFGVVTKFKFRLCPLNKHMTTFGIFWKKKADIINMISRWTELHEQDALPLELSCTTNMWRVNDSGKKPIFPDPVRGRMGGNFYGTQKELIKFLKKEFGSLIPMEGDKPVVSSDGEGLDSYFSAISEKEIEALKKEKCQPTEDSTDKSKKRLKLLTKSSIDYIQEQFNLITGETDKAVTPGHIHAYETSDSTFQYDVLPGPPNVTCDMPHPHKITSLYPKDGIDHRKLANQIYDQLASHPFLADVNRYMVWHCLGGAMRSEGFEEQSSFAYRHKPYMLQLQAWWNHAGQLRNDKSRDKNYTNWVNDFRKELDSKDWTEGAFINFVDKDIVEDSSTPEGRLELLQHYYGDNLNRLRAVKTKFDPDNVFDFGMSIPTENS